MLLQRIITALILVPLVVLAVYFLPSQYFTLLIGLIVLAAGWEWSNLIGFKGWAAKTLFQGAMLLPMLFIYFWTQILE
ncbi:MAG: phosphatidate cytidylyltransferase, partial [Gammaproteobacteria bacterium]